MLTRLSEAAGLSAVTNTGPSAAMLRLQDEVVDLFVLFRQPLLRYLATFGLAVPDCEEILQEVFLSLFRHLRQDKPRGNIRGWLFRVAHNLALKERYRLHRRPETATKASAGEDSLPDPAPNPEDRFANNQTWARLHSVMRALPVLDARCLSLRVEGLRYREIAAVLDMSLGAVSISLSKSLARLARAAER